MCNTTLQYRNYGQLVDPFAFSTLHLLRTCNRLLLPPTELESYYAVAKDAMKSRFAAFHNNDAGMHNNATRTNIAIPQHQEISVQHQPISVPTIQRPTTDDSSDTEAELSSYDLVGRSLSAQKQDTPPFYDNCVSSKLESAAPVLQALSFPNFCDGFSLTAADSLLAVGAGSHAKASSLPSFEYNSPPHIDYHSHASHLRSGRSRTRSEKRPIPDEQKDDRYYERRKRNNEAAKKSRDARKLREDRTAVHARVLEEQNKLLSAEVMHLRAEIDALHQRFKDGF